mgnify:FL=1
MAAYPNIERMDGDSRSYVALDPPQADFSRLLRADGRRTGRLRAVRERLATPIHFLRGNHEDFQYLSSLPLDETSRTAKVDPFDLFRYVPDGTVLQFVNVRIAFLGGIETEKPDPRSIDQDAYASLMDLGAGSFDVLATHDPPYGIGIVYRCQMGGSRLLTSLIEHTQPTLHLSGHVHHLNG